MIGSKEERLYFEEMVEQLLRLNRILTDARLPYPPEPYRARLDTWWFKRILSDAAQYMSQGHDTLSKFSSKLEKGTTDNTGIRKTGGT